MYVCTGQRVSVVFNRQRRKYPILNSISVDSDLKLFSSISRTKTPRKNGNSSNINKSNIDNANTMAFWNAHILEFKQKDIFQNEKSQNQRKWNEKLVFVYRKTNNTHIQTPVQFRTHPHTHTWLDMEIHPLWMAASFNAAPPPHPRHRLQHQHQQQTSTRIWTCMYVFVGVYTGVYLFKYQIHLRVPQQNQS